MESFFMFASIVESQVCFDSMQPCLNGFCEKTMTILSNINQRIYLSQNQSKISYNNFKKPGFLIQILQCTKDIILFLKSLRVDDSD